MKLRHWFLGSLVVGVCAASLALAESKTYQVTGPVQEVDQTKIVVKKGNDNWTLYRDAGTQIQGNELKVGDKVTVEYTMTATKVEVKKSKK
jgi:hypothetical protein